VARFFVNLTYECCLNIRETTVLAGEISAAVADVRDVSQLVSGFENLSDDPVRRIQVFALQEIKPDRINVDSRIFSEPERVQEGYLPKLETCVFLIAASF
jgi:hypothetical protein